MPSQSAMESDIYDSLESVRPLAARLRALESRLGPPEESCPACVVAESGLITFCDKHARRLRMYRTLKDEDSTRRSKLVKDFLCWTFPSKVAFKALAANLTKAGISEILSVGSGAALWERLLVLAGFSVTATDAKPPATTWMTCHTLTSVEAVRSYPVRCLMCVWPYMGGRTLFDALEIFEGDYVIYVGEVAQGCPDDGAVAVVVERGHWVEVVRAAGAP